MDVVDNLADALFIALLAPILRLVERVFFQQDGQTTGIRLHIMQMARHEADDLLGEVMFPTPPFERLNKRSVHGLFLFMSYLCLPVSASEPLPPWPSHFGGASIEWQSSERQPLMTYAANMFLIQCHN